MRAIFFKTIRNVTLFAALAAASGSILSAQTNVVTVTNYVTVLVTNIVTVTNVVTAAPAAASVVAIAPPPKNSWQSSITAGLTLTRGNKSTTLFTTEFLTAKKTPKNEYSLGLGTAYGSQGSTETVNNYKAFGQWNRLFTERFFGYARADALRDLIADLDYRLSIGPGAGYYLLKATNTTLAVEAGAGMEFQRLGGKDEQFSTTRFAERFEHKFNNRARLWQTAELVPQVDNFDNYVVNFEIGMEAAISKSFSLKTYFDDTYANQPAAGRLKNDAKIVAGVSYKF
jgi:putative salt-induced outer membrane protein YdiY